MRELDGAIGTGRTREKHSSRVLTVARPAHERALSSRKLGPHPQLVFRFRHEGESITPGLRGSQFMTGDDFQIKTPPRTLLEIVKVDPKPTHTYQVDGPFERAHITLYGRTDIQAIELARDTRTRLAAELPPDRTCWAPAYQGFSENVGRHAATFRVVLGEDREADRALIDQFLASL